MSFFSNLVFYRNRRSLFSKRNHKRRRRNLPIAAIESLEDRTLLSADFGFAAALGGTSLDFGNDVAVDAAGNVYTTGLFSGTADFDSGPDTFNLISAGSFDIFVSKLDSAGNFVWAKRMGGPGDDRGHGMTVDSAGNVYTTGQFFSTADFDPGTGISNLTSVGSHDIFVSKLDSAGNFVWAKQMGGTGYDFGGDIAVDGSGNVYITGGFFGTADFDPGLGTFNMTSAGEADLAVTKLDSAGDFVWAKRMGGTGDDRNPVGGIALDDSGNVYTTGYFFVTADFDPGPGTFNLTSVGSHDIFVSKLDSAGNFVWAKQMGGAGPDAGFGIAVDSSGNVYTTGQLFSTADFDPGSGTFNLISAGSSDIFVSKLDSAGNFVWAKRMGGPGDDLRSDMTLDGAGNVYTTGSFDGTVDFDPGTGTFNLTSAGARDMFVSKLDGAGDFVYVLQISGPLDQGHSGAIAVDGAGNVYTTGSLNGVVDFDPGPGTFNLTSKDIRDVFVLKLTQNQPPVAVDDNFAINEDGTLIVGAANGVLANDTDSNGDALTVTGVVSGPSSGSLTLNGDGSFTYIPVADFNGTVTFTYEISDGNGGFSTATVTIEVLSADSQFGALGQQVQFLIDSGVLNKGQGNSLLKQLGAAQRAHNRGQADTAINNMNAFINHLEDLILNGVLTDLLVNPLIDDAKKLIESLG